MRVTAVTTPPRSSSGKSMTSFDELRQIHQEYVIVARDVMQFIKFIDLNVTAVRKILKKYDKKMKTLT
jgi:SPX domain protein involved in polyphosphate accumulation